jgi:hypothetical protein
VQYRQKVAAARVLVTAMVAVLTLVTVAQAM